MKSTFGAVLPLLLIIILSSTTLAWIPETALSLSLRKRCNSSSNNSQTKQQPFCRLHSIIIGHDDRQKLKTILSATMQQPSNSKAPSTPLDSKSGLRSKPIDSIATVSTRTSLLSSMIRWSMSTLLVLSVMISSFSLLPTSSSSDIIMAWASDYNSLSEEQKLVAEAWRLVDNSFLDRTFAKQDWWNVREQYVKRKYKSMEEARQAIAEFTATLQDPYTRYLPPSKYQSLVDSATGTLAGVGMEISTSGESSARHILASDVEPNSPASRAGIQPGDVFVQVAGTNVVVPDASAPASTVAAVTTTETVASTPEEVAALLRGPTNSKVNVVMERQGKTYEYILTREPITITSVSSYVIPHVNGWNNGKVGVIRIKSFSGTTASTVASKLQDLEQSQGVSALVLDLRSNPGGLLPGGVDTASLFLPANQPVVYVVDKKGVVTSSASLADGMDLTTPLVVLVDANTASAAEVVTAALQEDQRAIIVGQQTFGKGIVQTIRSLQEGQQGGLAITVARYETPLHHDINKQGVMVDVSAPMDCPKKDVSACLPAVALTKAQELLQQK